MKRWILGGTIVVALLLVAGAGYLGLRGARGQAGDGSSPIEGPPTVRVTRGDVQQTVIAPGVLVDTGTAAVSARVGGELAELLVRPGDAVQAQEVVARLRVDDLRRQVAEAEGELASAQLAARSAEETRLRQIAAFELDLSAARAGVALAEAGQAEALSRAEGALAAAQEREARLRAQAPEAAAQVTIARVERERAEEALARAQIAYKEALDRPWEEQQVRDALARELARAEQDLAVAQAQHEGALAVQTTQGHDVALQRLAVTEAGDEVARLRDGEDPLPAIEVQRVQGRLDELRAGVDPLLLDRVERAQGTLERLRARLADAEVRAPVDGVVLEVRARVGQAVTPGSELFALSDPRVMEARTTVIEEDLPLVKVGQPAELYFDAEPDAVLQGRVARIVPRRVPGEDRPLYAVYLAPSAGPPPALGLPEGLLPGMTVDAAIVIDRRQDVLRLPRALLSARADGGAHSDGHTQVRVWASGRAELRDVRVGLRGDVYVEIVEGLREGQEVLGE